MIRSRVVGSTRGYLLANVISHDINIMIIRLNLPLIPSL